MNKYFFFLRSSPAAALVACLFGAPAAYAQTITNSGALSFGVFVAGTGGSVVLASNGGRSRTGGVMLVPQGSAATAAQFIINGNVASITLPSDRGGAGDITLTRAGGTETMVVKVFTRSFIAPLLRVGATLSVRPAQPPGSYSGSFNVIVNFE